MSIQFFCLLFNEVIWGFFNVELYELIMVSFSPSLNWRRAPWLIQTQGGLCACTHGLNSCRDAGSLKNNLLSASGIYGHSLSHLLASLPSLAQFYTPLFPGHVLFLNPWFLLPHTFTLHSPWLWPELQLRAFFQFQLYWQLTHRVSVFIPCLHSHLPTRQGQVIENRAFWPKPECKRFQFWGPQGHCCDYSTQLMQSENSHGQYTGERAQWCPSKTLFIKMGSRSDLTPVRMAITKKSIHNKCWRRCGEKGTLLHCWWECKLVQPLWRTVWSFLKKLKIETPYDPAIPLLGIYLEKTITCKDTCTPVFIAALFTIARTWKPPKCPWTGASLVTQRLRIHLPMQGTRVRALVGEDATCHGATKPVRHNYWACALEPASHEYWAHMPQLLQPACLEPVLHNKRSHHNEKPTHCKE